MMPKIPSDEMIIEPSSLRDDAGQVFWWNGEVYRGVRASHASFFRDLCAGEERHVLFSKGLVRSEVASFSVPGFDLVLKHERIPVASYCAEWSSEMLRDAALLICDLSTHLHERGLMLKDVHPWNILFEGSCPRYVDWGSIVPYAAGAVWPYREFQSWYLFPLDLMAGGLSPIARNMMLDVMNPPRQSDVLRLLLNRLPWTNWLRIRARNRKYAKAARMIDLDYFDALRNSITSSTAGEHTTEWSSYYGLDNRYTFDDREAWPAKVRTIDRLLSELRPSSLLDIGCNRGWMSELAARKGSRVVAIDVDEPSINALYRHARAENLNILPLIMDFCRPTPAHGIGNAYPDATRRLRADMVLALALTHHLVFKRGLSFEFIVRQLAEYAGRWLVVEFVPPDDIHVQKWMSDKFAWYSLDAFRSALDRHFESVEMFESTPHPRVLFFCKKSTCSVSSER